MKKNKKKISKRDRRAAAKLLGSAGGSETARRMTKEQLSERGKKAIEKRWNKTDGNS